MTTPDTFTALASRLDLDDALTAEVVILMEYAHKLGVEEERERLFGAMTWQSPRAKSSGAGT